MSFMDCLDLELLLLRRKYIHQCTDLGSAHAQR